MTRPVHCSNQDYMSAIKKAKAAKPIDYNDLPSLPDFPPIPIGGSAAASRAPANIPVSTGGGPPGPAQRVPPVAVQQGGAAPPVPPRAQAVPAGRGYIFHWCFIYSDVNSLSIFYQVLALTKP